MPSLSQIKMLLRKYENDFMGGERDLASRRFLNEINKACLQLGEFEGGTKEIRRQLRKLFGIKKPEKNPEKMVIGKPQIVDGSRPLMERRLAQYHGQIQPIQR